jgi:hypothetical protein
VLAKLYLAMSSELGDAGLTYWAAVGWVATTADRKMPTTKAFFIGSSRIIGCRLAFSVNTKHPST